MKEAVTDSPRAALITGANGVIGRAVARRLAEDGIQLCLSDVTDCTSLATELKSEGTKAFSIVTDVRNRAEVHTAVEACTNRFGRLDILVAIAGVTSFGPFQAIAEGEWDRVTSVNLKGVFFSIQEALTPMRNQGFGRIVTIGSILAKNGGNPRPWLDASEQDNAANAAYGAAKAGVHALTLYAAKENAHRGITVNCIAPGPIASPMTKTFPQTLLQQIPIGRLGKPEEVANAIAFIVSDDAGFITGEVLDINGGLWVD